MVVQEVHRLADDPLEEQVVRGLGNGGVESPVVVGGEKLARACCQDGQPLQVLHGGPARREPGRLDLHGAADLHELGHAVGAGAQ